MICLTSGLTRLEGAAAILTSRSRLGWALVYAQKLQPDPLNGLGRSPSHC